MNSLLREKVSELGTQNAALQTESAICRDDLRQARAEIERLKTRIEELTLVELDQTDSGILKLIAEASAGPSAEDLAESTTLHLEVVEYRLERLRRSGYVRRNFGEAGYPNTYELTQKAREYLIQNGLIK